MAASKATMICATLGVAAVIVVLAGVPVGRLVTCRPWPGLHPANSTSWQRRLCFPLLTPRHENQINSAERSYGTYSGGRPWRL